ncbi:MAG: hypothetical protein US67_C0049G0001, partial [Candidatus Woesebacteria bacterium GW2011_GWD1_38_10]
SLIRYWLNHPFETPAIIRFFLKKAVYIPKFTKRNVLTEKEQFNFEENLDRVTHLYQKYGNKFNAKYKDSYTKLDKLLTDKEQILYFQIRKYRPSIVLETGVAAGVSSGYILRALKDNHKGKLYSIDLPFQWYTYGNHELHLDSLPPGRNSGYLVPDDLKTRWHLLIGDTYQLLPKLLQQLKTVDVFFHDSEHTYKTMTFEYNQAWPHIKKNGLLLSDDIDFNHAFNKFIKKHSPKYFVFKNIGVIIKSK